MSSVNGVTSASQKAAHQAAQAAANASSKSETQESRELNQKEYQNFLNLLMVQMRNQDPLSPMNTEQMTQQLIGFNQVEQSIRQNERLDRLIELQSPSGVTQYLGYVGKMVSAQADGFQHDGHVQDFKYTFARKDLTDHRLRLIDSAGRVSEQPLGGKQSDVIRWNGLVTRIDAETKQSKTARLPLGAYTIEVVGLNAAGKEVKGAVELKSRVTALNWDGKDASLMLGNVSVPFSAIKSIEDFVPVTHPPIKQTAADEAESKKTASK
ncbi:MAG: flagellar hook capping FlgD N-terminal domain-containing protein [Pseudomonadota bacterium]